jgi:hypothetical protein
MGLLPPGYKGDTFMGAKIVPANYNVTNGLATPNANTTVTGGSSGTTTSNITTTPTTDVGLPSWLTLHPDDLQSELLSQYKGAGQSIIDSTKKTGKQMKKAANIDYGQNMRQAANATAQLAAVSQQQGGTAKTSSIVGGQMAQSAQKQRQDAKVQIAQMKSDAVVKAATLSSSIAGNIANLRTSYLSNLAGIATQQRGQNIQSGQFQQQFNATQQAQTAQLAQEQAASAAALAPKPASGLSYTGQGGAGMGVYQGPTAQTDRNGYPVNSAGQHLYGIGG